MKQMFFWNSLAFSIIQGIWQFDLWFLCLMLPARRVRKTWNGGKWVMKRETHIIWQAGKQRALLFSMAGRPNGSFLHALFQAEVTWDLHGIAILGSLITAPWRGSKVKALLLIRNILFCFHGDGGRCRQWSRAESKSTQECPFGMLTRTITRAQFAAPSSHGVGSGLCSSRLQQRSSCFWSTEKSLRSLHWCDLRYYPRKTSSRFNRK